MAGKLDINQRIKCCIRRDAENRHPFFVLITNRLENKRFVISKFAINKTKQKMETKEILFGDVETFNVDDEETVEDDSDGSEWIDW